ncbi:MAG: ATP-binding protein [bacterium]
MVTKKTHGESERPSVLLVCEPNTTLQQAADELKTEGYRVRQTTSTYRAIVEQTSVAADVVVIDTGPLLERDMEVFAVFRSMSPPPFLIASFPPSAREKARAALESGADAYIVEPFDAREVSLLVRRSLERRTSPGESQPLGQKLAALGRFAAGVAHEINNPLTTISGWIQLSLADMAGEDPSRRTFETMQEEVDRIAQIVSNLLCFAGQPPLHEEPVNINEVLEEVLAAAETESIDVTCSFHEDLPLILASREQIRQAIEQVVSNAVKNLHGKGELRASTRPVDTEDQVVIEIADDGCGIPEAALARIFDPFFSGNGGTGLGLSAAYGIIQGHGGTIEAISREHEGTRFIIRLPLHRLRTRNRILEYAK